MLDSQAATVPIPSLRQLLCRLPASVDLPFSAFYRIMQNVAFCVSPLSLVIMVFRAHQGRVGALSLARAAVCHVGAAHLVCGPSVCSHLSTIVHYGAVNTGAKVFVWTYMSSFSLGRYLGAELLGQMLNSFLAF